MTWTRNLRSSALLSVATLVACSGGGSDRGTVSDSAKTTTTTTTTATTVKDTSPPAPKITPFTKGDASVTLGKPLKMKLYSGKFSASPAEEYGETEAMFLNYTPDGTMGKGDGIISFNAGRRGKDAYHVDDLTINANGSWRYNPKVGHCAIAVDQASPAGLRGTITCTGDPKGPTTPIVFSATP